jgi:PAS domain S-box-containing protein
MANSAQTADRLSASILIVDDHAAVRAGLRNLISSHTGWSICGEAADGEQAVSLALELKPSAIVMDISMPGIDGLEATRRVRERLPAVEVLIVSQHDSEQVVSEAQKAGARGFVVKSHLSADLLPALEAALLHRSRISSPVSKAWQDAISNAKHTPKALFTDPGPHDDLDLMSGGGDMGALMRAHDWSRTPFGPVSTWPQSLRTALRICLDSRFPIVIWWGPELRLLYNDACMPGLGTTKHPRALGAPGPEVWSDVWETIGPMLEGVMRTGQATWENDQLLLFDRHGYVEESYWTYSYSAIRLSSGEVGGVFSVVHEVTDRVLSARRLETLREVADQVVQAKNEVDACTLAMQSILHNRADCPYAKIYLLEGNKATRVAASFDADARMPRTLDLSQENEWAIQEAVKTRTAQVFSVKDRASLPGTLFGGNQCERAMSIPILGTNRDPIGVLTVGISPYCPFDNAYREFLESLSRNLAANINNARAYELERKLRFDAELLAAIVASSDDAIISKSLEGIITSWNKSAERIFGYTAEEAVGRHITLIIPGDRRDEEVHILERLRRGKRVDHFQTVRVRKDGSSLDVSLTISPVRDSAGRVVGASKVARDITAQSRAEQALRESEERFRAIVETTPECVKLVGRDGTLLHMNSPGLQMVGASRAEEVVGKSIYDVIAPEHRDKFRAFNERVCGGEKGSLEFDIIGLGGKRRQMETHAAPLRSPDGMLTHLAVSRDVSDRKRSEENYRQLAETLEAEVRARTVELENRNFEVLRQSELLREFSRRLLQAQDEERRRIARELHDSAGQTLTVLGIDVAKLVQKAGRNAPELATAAEMIQESVQQLHREIRTTSYLLHPPLLDESGLSSALHWYIDGLADRSDLDVSLDISDEVGRLPRDMELMVFRLVQECLTNIHRHSGSKTASIRIVRKTDILTVEVQDRGKGMSSEKLTEIQARGSGVGIRGMRERLRQFEGSLNIESDSSGTQIVATIPIPKTMPEEESGLEPLQTTV